MSRKFSKELNEKIDRDLDDQTKSKRRRSDRDPPKQKKSKSKDKKKEKEKEKKNHDEIPRYITVDLPQEAIKALLKASGQPSDCKGMKLEVKLSIPEKEK